MTIYYDRLFQPTVFNALRIGTLKGISVLRVVGAASLLVVCLSSYHPERLGVQIRRSRSFEARKTKKIDK